MWRGWQGDAREDAGDAVKEKPRGWGKLKGYRARKLRKMVQQSSHTDSMSPLANAQCCSMMIKGSLQGPAGHPRIQLVEGNTLVECE